LSILETRLINEHHSIPARALEIRLGSKAVTTPAYAVNVADIDQKLVRREDLCGVVEVPLSFKPEKLSKLHNSLDYSEQFTYRVNSHVNRIPDNQLAIAIPILEDKKGYTLGTKEAASYGTHIAELVSNPRINIVCTPVFHRIAEANIDVLVKNFLDTMTSYEVGVALSIPYVSREAREKLVRLYLEAVDKNNRALLNFLCVDYNGSNPISKYALHNYVLNYIRMLQEEIGEPVAIYGVNVKYSRIARKYDKLPARDLASYFAQVDIYGANHKRKQVPKEVAEKARAEETLWKQKLLDRSKYTYVSLNNVLTDIEQATPETALLKELIEKHYHRTYLEKTIKRINVRNTLREINILRPLFSGRGWSHYEEPLQYLNSKEIIRIDNILLERLRDYAKITMKADKSRNKRIDEYILRQT
jgi:hypothetical protein